MAASTPEIDAWLQSHQEAYNAATQHPFLHSVRNGTVTEPAFNKWLGQDYLFVQEFARFVASVLLKAPRKGADLTLILGGLAALDDELKWFQGKCAERGVNVEGLEPAPANQEYISRLKAWSAPEVSYPVATSVLWAIEMVYNNGWGICLEEHAKTPENLRDCCERWGSSEFRAYVDALKILAEGTLSCASEREKYDAELAFEEVLGLERSFWDMSK